MNEAVIIYPHQLFTTSPALKAFTTGDVPVYLIEEPLLLTHNPIHRQKLILHKLSMDAYERTVKEAGHRVTRLRIENHETTASVFEKLRSDCVEQMHIVDTTDYLLEQAIARCGIQRVWYDSPLFILSKEESMRRFIASNRFMFKFYKELRKDKDILMDGESPMGGQWSFDEDNRQKIPKGATLPADISLYGNADTTGAAEWAENVPAEKYGEPGCWLPYTHDGARAYLHDFLEKRFDSFGPYEDAMTTEGVRLWHSTLSPLLNLGLLSPQEVIDSAIKYSEEHSVRINSVEGFVRQILGWREFIRASYECDGVSMRNSNNFNHRRELKDSFWTGETGITPVDQVITNALRYGYSHHIERLMVMGNFMLLCAMKPDEVYRWFMGMYIDAYDWVMVPNVYGMSQFADGGSFATKPYISGANYIKKMSDFKKGDWETVWTALYWDFVSRHIDTFRSNHRLSMMPKALERMNDDTRNNHFSVAKEFLNNL